MLHPIVALATAALVGSAASAQVLQPPALAAGEFVVTNAQGCAVVGRMPNRHEQSVGRTPERQRALFAELEYDKRCQPGELLLGPVATVEDFFGRRKLGEPVWYDFGRAFGIREATPAWPFVSVSWQEREVRIPVGADTPEGLARVARSTGFSTTFRDGIHYTEVHLGRITDATAHLPATERPWTITVIQDAHRQVIPCAETDVRLCFDLWWRHAEPVIGHGRNVVEQVRPLIAARQLAIAAHIRATSAGATK